MKQFDLVEKIGGDYTFIGVIVSCFKNLVGKDKFVVEDDRGRLEILNTEELKIIEKIEGELVIKKSKEDRLDSHGLNKLNTNSRLLSNLSGGNSLLVTYMSSKVIDGGKGNIEPNTNIKQFAADISNLSPNRLKDWDNGFYRNLYTTQRQFLIKSDKYIFKFDNFLEQNLSVKVAMQDFTETNFRVLNIDDDTALLEDIVDNLKTNLIIMSASM